jgi:hypothetical protein
VDTVSFDVAYNFGEYRAFVLAHLRQVRGVSPGLLGRAFFSGVAAIAFAAKKRKMPLCSFRIDEDGIPGQPVLARWWCLGER